MNTLITYSLAGLIGLIVGSTLNVIISRLPVMVEATSGDEDDNNSGSHDVKFNLWMPRSRCKSCLNPILFRDLIPVLSWVLLKGRCRNCSVRISWRYPIVETLGCLFAILLVGHFEITVAMFCAGVCFALLIATSTIDVERGMLLDELTYPLLWCGLVTSIWFQHSNVFPSPSEAIVGVIAGYLSFWLINFLFRVVRKKDGLGHGDFKLLAAIGAWVGWHLLPVVVLIAITIGLVYGIVRVLQKEYSQEDGIPFGPFLAMGAIGTVIYRDELLFLLFRNPIMS